MRPQSWGLVTFLGKIWPARTGRDPCPSADAEKKADFFSSPPSISLSPSLRKRQSRQIDYLYYNPLGLIVVLLRAQTKILRFLANHSRAAHTIKTVGIRSLGEFIYNLGSLSTIGTMANPAYREAEKPIACKHLCSVRVLQNVTSKNNKFLYRHWYLCIKYSSLEINW